MNILSNPVFLILISLVLVIVVNLLLVASVQNQAKTTGGGTIKRMLKAIREPFTEGDSDLDKLAGLVDQLDPSLKSNQENSDQP